MMSKIDDLLKKTCEHATSEHAHEEIKKEIMKTEGYCNKKGRISKF